MTIVIEGGINIGGGITLGFLYLALPKNLVTDLNDQLVTLAGDNLVTL